MTKPTTNKVLGFFFLFFAVFLFGYTGQAQTLGSLYAQEGDRQLYVEEGENLKSALEKLEQHYNVGLLYRSNIVEGITIRQSANLSLNVEEALSFLLKGTDLRFKALNPKTYGIYKNALIVPQAVEADVQQSIRGTVTDAESGEVLPGVNVIVAGSEETTGSTIGTTTDMRGNYEIQVPDELNTLIFSFVGYQRTEIQIDGRNEVNVELSSDVQLLEDIVVIGYGSVQKSDITGSVSSVRAEQLNTGAQSSVDQAIQGRIPGVQVTQSSAEPGGEFSIRIRGTNSITAGNEPLYVIDGLPGVNPQNSLNPADIQSIEVLKDASATAIYGSRGANGVILITTKKGQSGKVQINYNGSIGIQESAKKLDLMNAQEYMSFLNDVSQDRGEGPVFSQVEMNAIEEGTNWQDEVLRRAPVQDHQLSFSGGSEDTQYYLSLNNYNQDGIVINSNMKRFGAKLNITHTLERFRFGLNLNNSVEQNKSIPLGVGSNRLAGVIATAIQMDPIMPVRNEDGSFSESIVHDLDNPVAQAKTIDFDKETSRIFGNIYGEYDILNNLYARLNLGINRSNGENENYISSVTKRGQLTSGQATLNQSKISEYLMELTLNYDTVLQEDHELNAVAGYSFQEFTSSGFMAEAIGFPTDAFHVNNLGSGDSSNNLVNSQKQKNTLLSGLSRINYSYRSKYLATVSFRVDGSSRFGDDKKFGFFPSMALAWRISNEPFFESMDLFSELKFRGSYGITGNQEIGNYRSLVLLGTAELAGFSGQNFTSIAPIQLANPNLKWETTKQFNVGLDFGLWADRITGTVDYFVSETSDLLLELPIPRTTGFNSSLQNVGDTRNSGLELNINSRNLIGNFNWSTNFNFATLNNEVTNLGELPRILQGSVRFVSDFTILREGSPINSYFGYNVEGIFQDQNDVDVSAQPNASPGDLRFTDVNQDGQITPEDRTILGDPYPDFTIGLNNNFGYRGFELDLFFEGRFGFELANFTRIDSENPIDFLRNRESYVINRWTPDNPTSKNPSFVNIDSARNMNSRIVQDASFLRLKSARLSYTFPNINLGNISSITIYATGQNLLTITDYEGFNPDVNVLGSSNIRIDYNAYPLARIYTLGINIRI